jgi:hypothetical protein
MASILAFTPREAARTPKAGDDNRPATVIIFPGVRYERTATTTSPKTPKWLPPGWMAPFQPLPQS